MDNLFVDLVYLVWPNEAANFGTFVLSSGIALVVVHIVIALAIRPINDTDDMEKFQMITRYFLNVALATWRIGRELYDGTRVMLTEILNAWLTFYLILIGRDREMHLPNNEGIIRDPSLLLVEEIEVRIFMNSTAVREL